MVLHKKAPGFRVKECEAYHRASLELSLPIVVIGGGEMSRAGLNEPPTTSNQPFEYFKPHDELHITHCTRAGRDG